VSRTERAQFSRWATTLLLVVFVSACGQESLELFPGYGGASGPDAAASADAGDESRVDATTITTADARATDSSLPDARPDSGIGDSAGDDAIVDDDRVIPILLLEGGAPCEADVDCHGENHRCQTGLHICVQCIGDPADCAKQGNESKCNLVNYTCAVPCAPDGSCSEGDVCDSQGVCADCLVASHCPASQPRCVLEECVCLSNADCEGGVCGPDQTCR
jgi:hypothetical protein